MIELYLAVLLFGVGSYINMNKPVSPANNKKMVKKVNKNNENNKEHFTKLSPAPYHRVNNDKQEEVPVNVIPKLEKGPSRKELEQNICKKEVVSSLTGRTLNKDSFMTNSDGFKMTPYFRGSVKQNINDISQTRLATHTGEILC